MLACITLTMPVMWNRGTTSRVTASGVALPQMLLAMALCMMLLRVHASLGIAVVPLV